MFNLETGFVLSPFNRHNMSKTFAVSDTWFNRPMDNEQNVDVGGYNDFLINNWNETVGRDDKVYVLGGFGIADLYNIAIKLNGEIHFLDNFTTDEEREYIDDMKSCIEKSSDVSLKDKFIFEDNQIKVLPELDTILTYYPLSDWRGKNTGTYCFHGLNESIDIASHNITCNSAKWNHIPVDISGIQDSILEYNSRIS